MPQFGASLTDNSRVVIYNCNMFIIQTTECHNWDIMLLSVDVLCVILVHIVTPFVNYLCQLNLLNPYVTTFLSFIHTCGILWWWFPFPFQGERTLIDKLCHGQTWKRMHNIQPKCNAESKCHNLDIMLLNVAVLCVITLYNLTPFVKHLIQLNLLNPRDATFLSFIHMCGILWRWCLLHFQGEGTLFDKLCHGQTWKRIRYIQPKCNAEPKCHNLDIMLLNVAVLCRITLHNLTLFVNFLIQLNLLNPFYEYLVVSSCQCL